jgi:O-antigen/teichoic acid export membrane protein
VISRVMFPAFSKIQDDLPRIQRIYLRMTGAIALVTFPLMLGLLAVAKNFVLAVFGAQWVRMIPLLQIFCITGMLQSIGTLNGNIYLSQGRTDLQFKVGVVIGLAGIGSIVIGLKWGVNGVAYAYGLFSFLVAYPSIAIAVSLIDLTFMQVVKNLASVFGCATTMAILVWGMSRLLPANWPHWSYLTLQVPVGIAVFWTLVHLFKVQAYQDTRALVIEQWHLHGKHLRRLTGGVA